MTTATFEIREDAENETFDVYVNGQYDSQHDSEDEAREAMDALKADSIREEIASLLESVSRLDSLEGLLKSVNRLAE